MKEIFLHIKPSKMLVSLKDVEEEWYISKLAKKSGATYVYTTKIVSIFRKNGLIEIEAEGRVKKIRLTDRGIELANALEEFIRKCEINEETKLLLK